MPINTDVETRMSCFSHKEFKDKKYCKKWCCFIEQDLCSMATNERIEKEKKE
jgi:hypothetical protein